MLFSTACWGVSPVLRETWFWWCQWIWVASSSFAWVLLLTESMAKRAGKRFCQKPKWRSILPLDWRSLATRLLSPRQPEARCYWEGMSVSPALRNTSNGSLNVLSWVVIPR